MEKDDTMDICLKQEKFHRIIFKKYRIKKLVKEEQTIRNLLCYYQELACKSYRTEAKMNYILGYLYDAKFKVNLTSFGSYSVIEYSLTAADPALIKDGAYTRDALEEYFTAFIEPVMRNGQAVKGLFDRAYEIYESDLLSREENLQAMAFKKAISSYFAGTSRDFSTFGSLDELKKITPADLYQYYLGTLQEETISFLSGNVEEKKNLQGITLTPKSQYHFKERGNPEDFHHEALPSEQCYVEIIYELGIYANDRLYYPMMFLNYILGGQASSLLFRIVREKYGLCYSISSVYLGATGILVLSAILHPQDYKKLMEAISEAFAVLKTGDFTIEEARNFYKSAHYIGKDYIETAVQNYLSDSYFLDSPKSFSELEEIDKVSKEDVLEAFHKVEQSFIYVYGGESIER